MEMSIADVEAARAAKPYDPPMPPCHWGDMRQHVFYGALYHWFVLFWNRSYPRFQPHRSLRVAEEFRLYLRRFLLMPFQALERMIATMRIRAGSFPYHLALLQLEHDASFQAHGPFPSQTAFLSHVVDAFAQGAPKHHHLIFKAHPLEDGRSPLRQDIRRFAKEKGISDRVHYVRGGKLAGLLKEARSAVTVNSTAGQQALWRGIPLRVFGAAVYAKPELVSNQPLVAFFADPTPPDTQAYRHFRDFLLATSQLPGSYYARKGRRQVIRRVADMMLSGQDPYAIGSPQSAAVRQQLRLVR
jgi:capsular polysaccharide export protein